VALENAAEIARAGCDWLVAGTSVFHTPDPGAAFRELERTARESKLARA
jgi:pentose-5-phosphate-3-epimerase